MATTVYTEVDISFIYGSRVFGENGYRNGADCCEVGVAFWALNVIVEVHLILHRRGMFWLIVT